MATDADGKAAEMPAFTVVIGTPELRRLLKILAPIVRDGEVRLDLQPDGMHVSAVDPSHVGMVVLRAAPSLFDRYEIERPGVLAVDAGKLGQLVKVPTGRGVFTLTPGPEGRLICTLGHFTRTMSTVRPESITVPTIPDLKPAERAEGVDPEGFNRAVKSAAEVSDVGRLHRSRGGISLSAKSEPGPVLDEPAREADTEIPAESVTGKGCGGYPLDFLGPMAVAVAGAESLTLAWGKDYPLTVGFRLDRTEDRPRQVVRGGRLVTHKERTVLPGAIEGRYLLAARVLEDGPVPGWAEHAADWYDWAMRIPEPAPESAWGAGAVDAIPDDVIAGELARVEAENRALRVRWEAELAAHPAEEERRRAAHDRQEEEKAARLKVWLLGPRHSAKRIPKYLQSVEFHPIPPPSAPPMGEPFPSPYCTHIPDREHRRGLRGHYAPGTSWGPKRPELAAQEVRVAALEVPRSAEEPGVGTEIEVFPEGPDSVPMPGPEGPSPPEPPMVTAKYTDTDGSEVEVSAPADTETGERIREFNREAIPPAPIPPDAPEGPSRGPDFPTFVGQMRAAGVCPTCRGSRVVDSRKHSYTCPDCATGPILILDPVPAPAPLIPRGGCVEDMTRAWRLANGRDAA